MNKLLNQIYVRCWVRATKMQKFATLLLPLFYGGAFLYVNNNIIDIQRNPSDYYFEFVFLFLIVFIPFVGFYLSFIRNKESV